MSKMDKIQKRTLYILLDMYSSQINYYRSYKEEKKMAEKGSWHFIPNQTHIVLKTFIALRDYIEKEKIWSVNSIYNSKFLDAGCGIGNILVMAKHAHLCEHIYGIELSDNMIKKAKEFIAPHQRANSRLNGDDTIHIDKANIMEYDNYGDMDIIYYYCPLRDFKMEMKFERKVEDDMKVGAIVMASFKQDYNIKRDKRFKKIKLFKHETEYSMKVYIKIKE